MLARNLKSLTKNVSTVKPSRGFVTVNRPTRWQNSFSSTRRSFSTATRVNASGEQEGSKPRVGARKIRFGKFTYALLFATASLIIYQVLNDEFEEHGVYAQELPPVSSLTAAELTHEVLTLNKSDPNRKPRVVILGTGWGAISLLQSIDHTKYEVVIVSPRNYFLFTPMLPSTATGAVDYRSIVDPIRCAIYRKAGNKSDSIRFFEARCDSVDYQNNKIVCEKANSKGTLTVEYDKLVVSVGATVNTFGTKGVEEYCHFLKEVNHARRIRKSLITALEKASYPGVTEEEKKRLLHCTVVGGGPAGTEVAAELNDFLVEEVNKYYPSLLPYMKISILEMTDHILSVFDKSLSEYTENKFKRDRINLVVNNRVLEVKDKELVVYDVQAKKEHRIPYGVCVWATGIKQNPLIETMANTLPDSQNHRRALVTDGYCVVQGVPQRNIYAIGDCSRIEQSKLLDKLVDLFNEGDVDKDGKLNLKDLESLIAKQSKKYPQFELYGDKVSHYYEKFDVNKDGTLDVNEFKSLLEMADKQLKPLPATAQVASQQGAYLGSALNLEASGKVDSVELFKYKHWGSFAFVGGNRAVADLPVYKSGGLVSFYAYKSAYFQRQVSWRNRFALVHDWIKTKTFGRDVSKF